MLREQPCDFGLRCIVLCCGVFEFFNRCRRRSPPAHGISLGPLLLATEEDIKLVIKEVTEMEALLERAKSECAEEDTLRCPEKKY
jgi:hypothetical protein